MRPAASDMRMLLGEMQGAAPGTKAVTEVLPGGATPVPDGAGLAGELGDDGNGGAGAGEAEAEAAGWIGELGLVGTALAGAGPATSPTAPGLAVVKATLGTGTWVLITVVQTDPVIAPAGHGWVTVAETVTVVCGGGVAGGAGGGATLPGTVGWA